MNKIILFIKSILIFSNIIVIYIFIMNNGLDFYFILIPFLILIFLTIKDTYRRQKLNEKYNGLVILLLLVNFLLFARGTFEQNFIPNQLYLNNNSVFSTNFNLSAERNGFINQNIMYLFILYASIFTYRYLIIDKKLKNKKYSKLIIVCIIANIILFALTCLYFDSTIKEIQFPILFFISNTILLGVEIGSLIKNNGLKMEWPIYICFFFNLFAYIAMLT